MTADYVCNGCIKALRFRSAFEFSGGTLLRQPRVQSLRNHGNFEKVGFAGRFASTVSPPPPSSRSRKRTSEVAPKPAVEPNAQTSTSKDPTNAASSPDKTSPNEPENLSPFRAALRDTARGITNRYSQEYMVYGAAEEMFKLCAQQADYDVPQAAEPDAEIPVTKTGEHIGVGTAWWYSELGLTPTFSTWAHITMLYMYALTVRLRYLPAEEFAMFQQHINNSSFAAFEERMIRLHRLNINSQRQGYLKDLFGQWRGVTVAYDEGLIRGDAALATAIWRNVFKADEKINVETVATVTSYLRRCLKMLDRMNDDQIRRVVMEWPGLEQEEVLVRAESPQLKAPFAETKAA